MTQKEHIDSGFLPIPFASTLDLAAVALFLSQRLESDRCCCDRSVVTVSLPHAAAAAAAAAAASAAAASDSFPPALTWRRVVKYSSIATPRGTDYRRQYHRTAWSFENLGFLIGSPLLTRLSRVFQSSAINDDVMVVNMSDLAGTYAILRITPGQEGVGEQAAQTSVATRPVNPSWVSNGSICGFYLVASTAPTC